MRFLYLYTDYFHNYDIPLTFDKLECEYDVFSAPFMTYDCNISALQQLEAQLSDKSYDAVWNFGYIPYISDLCERFSIPYVSWTYDSILHSLYHPSIENKCNLLFVYDKAEYTYLKTHFDVSGLFYLPLAVNTDRIAQIPHAPEDDTYYNCDISFVGDLYQGNTYVDLEPILSSEERHYFEQAFSYFHGSWGGDSIYDWFSTEDADFLQRRLPDYLKNDEQMSNQRFFADILLSKPIGSRERIDMLNRLACNHSVRLYTKPETDTSVLSHVTCYPYLNYYDAMSKAFAHSKINLNITLHGMVSGIPLRCFDIMGAGGFLLTNYQPELDDYFECGKNLVYYKNLEELEDMTAYYLSHEKERLDITAAGHSAIEQAHTYSHRISYMLDILKQF